MQARDKKKARNEISIISEPGGTERRPYEREDENKYWEDDENGFEYAPFCYT